MPSCEAIVPQLAKGLESASDIQSACAGITFVDVAKQALQLADLFVANIVPDFEDGEVGPLPALLPSMKLQAPANAAARSHANIDDVELPSTPLVEHIHAAKSRRDVEYRGLV